MINAGRDDWLLKLETIRSDPDSQECVSIYPLDGLTQEMAVEAMRAQGMVTSTYKLHPDTCRRSDADWIAHQHGNRILVRRLNY
jgi:hypothetical protein